MSLFPLALMRFFALASLLVVATTTDAAVITQNTSGSFSSGGTGFTLGQSVTTPSGGPWNSLSFNLVNSVTNAPFALGDLFLLSTPYGGAATALSSSTPGYVADTTTISGGVWLFAPGVTINSATQYFFYMNTAFNGPEILFSAGNPYAGGDASQSGAPTSSPFVEATGDDLVFALNGNVVSSATVPEPATWALAGLGLFGVAIARRRRNR